VVGSCTCEPSSRVRCKLTDSKSSTGRVCGTLTVMHAQGASHFEVYIELHPRCKRTPQAMRYHGEGKKEVKSRSARSKG
jgi:hypothetical protein